MNDSTKITQGYKTYYSPDTKIMHVDFFGNIELKDVVDSFSSVIRHEKFSINMPGCYDFTNAILDIDINDTEVVFHFVAGLAKKRGSEYLLAFIYSDEMTKTLMDFYRLAFSRTSIDVETFSNRDIAVEWIKESQ